VHKISFVQLFTRTHLNLKLHLWNTCQNYFWNEHLCALQVFFCAFVFWPLCARTCAQLRGNIAYEAFAWRCAI